MNTTVSRGNKNWLTNAHLECLSRIATTNYQYSFLQVKGTHFYFHSFQYYSKVSLILLRIVLAASFDSLDRNILWNLMKHYSIPKKFIRFIKNSYDRMTCRVLHAGRLSDTFTVKSGVKQGCLMSPFLFLLAIDWIMKETTDN